MITHDLGVIADLADDVLVMYAGKPAEYADRRTLYYRQHHPYTKGLLESVPGSSGARDRLKPIPGQPPSLINLPSGCTFHPRCEYVMDVCRSDEPPLLAVGDPGEGGRRPHRSACWLPPAALGVGPEAERIRRRAAAAGRSAAAGGPRVADRVADEADEADGAAGPGGDGGEGPDERS
jgi:oligopeptide/dipeptide ABC transporter ATP-binding protein